jgi:hypothetical protein
MARELPYIGAINESLRLEMLRDDSVLYFGQNIATTEADPFLAEFGPDRVRATPISETAEIGMAVGAALAGYRPVVELYMAEFMLVAMDQVVNEAPRLRYMTGGQVTVPPAAVSVKVPVKGPPAAAWISVTVPGNGGASLPGGGGGEGDLVGEEVGAGVWLGVGGGVRAGVGVPVGVAEGDTVGLVAPTAGAVAGMPEREATGDAETPGPAGCPDVADGDVVEAPCPAALTGPPPCRNMASAAAPPPTMRTSAAAAA